MSEHTLNIESHQPEQKSDAFKACLNDILEMVQSVNLDKESLVDLLTELGKQYDLRVDNLKGILQKQVEIHSKLKRRNAIEYDSEDIKNLKVEIVTLKINLTDYSALEKKYYKLLDEFFNLRMANQAGNHNPLSI